MTLLIQSLQDCNHSKFIYLISLCEEVKLCLSDIVHRLHTQHFVLKIAAMSSASKRSARH